MKTIAVLCMLIDHIGFLFFPEQIAWRMIGRLAMPIFAFSIARGAIYTSSMKRYMKKMLLFALISQFPFWWMAHIVHGGSFISLRFNIGFTFLIALWIINLIQTAESEDKPLGIGKLIIIGILLVSTDLLQFDYGSYGILVVLLCYVVGRRKQGMWVLWMGYTVLTYLSYLSSTPLFLLQEFGVLAFGIIFALQAISEKRIGRFFYIFYPLHMIVLCVIKVYLMIP